MFTKPTETTAEANSLPPWQQRVITERDELSEKIGKLAAFQSTEAFPQLDPEDQERLNKQMAAMCEYRCILSERIAAFS